MRGGCKRTDVDVGAGSKINTTGIGQEHLSVGVDAPQDLARVSIHHAVEDGAGCRWLHKVHRSAAANIEAAPVHHGTIAALGDGHHCIVLTDVDLPSHYIAIGGQLCVCGRRCMRYANCHQRQCQGLQLEATVLAASHLRADAFTACLCRFSHGNKGACDVVPDTAVNSVHSVCALTVESKNKAGRKPEGVFCQTPIRIVAC